MDYSISGLFKELVDHRLILPTRVPGTFGRSGVFEDVLERLDALILRIAKDDGAEPMMFPPVIDRTIIERTSYLESSPHLAGTVFSFVGNDRQALALGAKVRAGEPWADTQQMTHVCLTPAACYPVYPVIAGTMPAGGRLITLVGWAYRHEPSDEPTRMQSFRVREFIRACAPDEAPVWRDMWHKRGVDLIESLGLPAHSDVAADPFFGRAGVMLGDAQKVKKLKFEVQVPVISAEKPTALCSFNYHEAHFSEVFGIHCANGELAHTACLGFGMERCVMALFRHHGFDIAKWPAKVRERLWP